MNFSSGSDVYDEARRWRKVRRGLGWVRFGFFLALLPSIGHLAVAAYCDYKEGLIPDNFAAANVHQRIDEKELRAARTGNNPGVALMVLVADKLQSPDKSKQPGQVIAGATLWKELEVIYAYGIPALAFLVIMFGLLGCMRIPARTGGVALGTLFFTFVALVGFAVSAAPRLLPFFGQPVPQQLFGQPVPPETAEIAWTAFIFVGPLALGWLCIFLGQAGVALGHARILRDIALALALVVLSIGGVLIANLFYPLLLTSPKFQWGELPITYQVQASVYVFISAMVVVQMFGLTGSVRRALRRWMEENRIDPATV